MRPLVKRVLRRAGALALFMVLALPAWFQAPPVQAVSKQDVNDFYFDSLSVLYELDIDEEGRSTLRTTETFVAVFPDFDQNRGFIRDLVQNYDDHPTDLTVLSVTDENGNPRPFTLEKYGDFLSVVMAVAEGEFVHGVQTYVLQYTQRDVTKFFEDTETDEFYWDVNGTDWSQQFGMVRADIRMSPEVLAKFTETGSCYFGAFGEKNKCDMYLNGNTVSFIEGNLGSYENITFALAFEPHTFAQRPDPFLKRYPFLPFAGIASIAAAVLTSIISRIAAVRSGKTGRAIIAQYEPPADISVSVAAILLKEQTKAMTATLLDLAVRKKIKLLYSAKDDRYGVSLLDDSGLNPLEAAALKQILEKSKKVTDAKTVWFYERDTALGDAAEALKQSSKKEAKANGYTIRLAVWPGAVVAILIISSLVFPALHFILLGEIDAFGAFLAIGINLGIWGAIFLVSLAVAGTRKTKKGIEITEHLLGLKEYMRLAEADRIRMLQSATGAEVSDDFVVQIYERLLPYAVLFNQESQWQAELEKYYRGASPGWVSGTENVSLNTFQLSSFNSRVMSSPRTVTSSSGGSGSSFSSFGGSSGGGFSGGGGGGGGGRGI